MGYRALADLPGDLQDLAEVFHVHTGAELCLLACWKDSEADIKFTE
jgi:hypothetical protein